MNSSKYVIVYDLSDDKERNKLVKVLLDFGLRVQKSVFECRLYDKHYYALCRAIDSLCLKSGGIKLYRIDERFRIYTSGDISGEDSDSIYVHYV